MSASITASKYSARKRSRRWHDRILAAVPLAILGSVLAVASAQVSADRSSDMELEVRLYGSEQALVEEFDKTREKQAHQDFPNELDHVLSVLLDRAYPAPKVANLVQPTIAALCEQVHSLSKVEISDTKRADWIRTTVETKSFAGVLKELDSRLADDAQRVRLVDAGLTAMLGATGSVAAGVLNPAQTEWITNLMEARKTPAKERGTLGVDVSDWPTIKVMPNTPAAEAGLRDGDVVRRVDDKDAAELKTIAEALEVLRGPADTEVSFTVKRGTKTLTFDVRRASAADRIEAKAIDPDIVYIKIPQLEGSGIGQRVSELVCKHVTDATSAVILDLRDNNAGRPEETNAVADLFLDEKLLQIFEFRSGLRVAFKSKPGALAVPVVFLTNGNTGSCAEMLALALHDNGRATVIGQQTAGALYGKDFETLKDGRMVIFRSDPTVLSPTGQDYAETGLPPDIAVEDVDDSDEDDVLLRAVEWVRSNVPKHSTSAAR